VDKLYVLMPGEISKRLEMMLEYSLRIYEYEIIKTSDEMMDMKNKRILFAVELGDSGINIEHLKMLEKIMIAGTDFMKNSVGSIIINSNSELFSRDTARKTIFYANMAGCMFPGRPLSEATGSLQNLCTQKKISDSNMSLEDICFQDCKNVVDRLMNYNISKIVKPKILTLHASNYKTSNTISLWNMVKQNLNEYDINEIHIENGSVRDCKGCSYKACKHYSQSNNCFYLYRFHSISPFKNQSLT